MCRQMFQTLNLADEIEKDLARIGRSHTYELYALRSREWDATSGLAQNGSEGIIFTYKVCAENKFQNSEKETPTSMSNCKESGKN